MQHSEEAALDVADGVLPVESRDERAPRPQRLSDGAKAALYVLFGIFLAAFLIGIWPMLEIIQAPPLTK